MDSDDIFEKFILSPEIKYKIKDDFKLIAIEPNEFNENDVEYPEIKNFKDIICNGKLYRFKNNSNIYRFYGFKDIVKDKEFGFMTCEIDEEIDESFNKIHREFIKCLGEIVQFWRMPYKGVFKDLVSAFVFETAEIGIGEFEQNYLEMCNETGISIDYSLLQLRTFGYEGNGNRILYDEMGKVYKYAHDDDYHGLIKVKNVPKYTFYKYKNIETIGDFVIELGKYILQFI